jgi:invasion protein IalB
MPLRLAAPQSNASRARNLGAALVVSLVAIFAAQHFMSAPPRTQPAATPAPVAAAPAAPSAHGRWSIVFERPESCVDTCARVLETLAAVARDPASGISDGVAQIVVKETKGEAASDLIVLDPQGQPAGFITHPTDAGRIVSGLATLRATSTAGTPIASR